MISGLVRLCRPKQWIKNGFVFGPIVFSNQFTDSSSLLATLIAFVLFSIAAAAVYIVNDIRDVEADRAHPKKSKTRPLASGQVSIRTACILLAVLYVVTLSSLFWKVALFGVLIAYIILNLGYTFVLKKIPVVDIFTVAFGFVLRVYAGAVVIDAEISLWMLITTLCLALYLAAIKRRQELTTSTGHKSRSVLDRYSVDLVDRYAEMSATGALIFYSLFVLTEKPELGITIPLVLLGLFRYWYVVDVLQGGESPTDVLWTDWVIISCVVAWISLCVLVIGGWWSGI